MVSQITRPPSGDSTVPNDPQQLRRIRHTCAHVLAMSVQRLFPETQVTIGPWTDTGFYYDFDRATPFTPDDFTRIEVDMRQVIQANLPIIRETVDRDELRAEILQRHEPYKLEILDDIPPDQPITRYYIGCPDLVLPQGAESPSLFDIPAPGESTAAASCW